MFSTFAALSGLAFFLGLRTTGLAIVVLSILERSPGLLPLGWHYFLDFLPLPIYRCFRATGSGAAVGSHDLERRLVIRRAVTPAALRCRRLAAACVRWGRRSSGPGIHGWSALAARATGRPDCGPTALTASVEATASGAPLGAVDLGCGVLQRRTDLVHVQLDDCALLAFLGLVRARLQSARDQHPRATLQRLGDILRRVPPHRTTHEQGLAVFPLIARPVELTRGRGNGEVSHGRTRGCEPQLRVAGDVANDGDDGVASHRESFTSGRRRRFRRRGAAALSAVWTRSARADGPVPLPWPTLR